MPNTEFTIESYDRHSRHMDVVFSSGARRRFFGVPDIVHDELVRSPYPDRSFYDNVVRCQYPSARLV